MRTVFLTDFGLARQTTADTRYTRTGQVLGTPGYLSPEAARGETSALTPATDVWALGCVLYELLASRPAFAGESPAEQLAGVLTAEPMSLRRGRPDLSAGLERVVRAALAKAPADRPADAAALRDDLDRVLRGEAPRVRSAGRRTARAWTLAALAVAAVAVGASAWRRTPDTAPAPAVPDATATEVDRLARLARLAREGRPDEARARYRAALALAPTRDDLGVELGLLEWATGRETAALDALDAVPSGTPAASRARLLAAIVVLCQFDERGVLQDAAGPRLEPLRATDPVAAALQLQLAGDPEGAAAALVALPGWEAALARALVDAGRARASLETRLRNYDAVLAAGPPLAWVFVNRAQVHCLRGDPTQGLADAERAVALAPDFAHAVAQRGAARVDVGDVAGGLADLDRAVALAPDLLTARHDRGNARRQTGDPAGALADYDHVLAANPHYLRARLNRAALRNREGDLAGARVDCDAALALDARAVPALLTRGHVRLASGDPTGALADYDAALALEPAHVLALLARSRAHDATGRPAAARADLDAAAQLAPGAAAVRTMRGLHLRTAGDLPAALEEFRAAAIADPRDERLWLNLASLARDLECWDEAAAAYRRALAVRPDLAMADDVRALIAECEARAGAAAPPPGTGR